MLEEIYNIHDIECNQKYGNGLPYSFHLKAVGAQGNKFGYLVEDVMYLINYALAGHDLIEDARMTYNDVITLCSRYFIPHDDSEFIANIIYDVTDEKGRNRGERKNDKYYEALRNNKYALFVKLADLSANILYSKLFNTKQYEMYKKEFPSFKSKLYREEFSEFFDYVENL